MECLLPYLCMVTVPHIMVGLERMLDYRGVGLARFHCSIVYLYIESTLTMLSCQWHSKDREHNHHLGSSPSGVFPLEDLMHDWSMLR